MISFDRNTPVLLIVYNRPNTTEKVLERIREARPKRLYVAVDAPKCDADIEECTKVQSLFDDLGTDILVFKKYQSVNLGCDAHCYAAISWFFEQEPEGIILEDDCVPSLSFFGFCSTLLERYRNDERIGHIAGSNYQFGKKRGDGTYYFSNLTHVGGWAGWRRVWKEHISRKVDFNQFIQQDYLAYLPSHAPFQNHWERYYALAHRGTDFCWDYKYAFSNLVANRLSIIPNCNLINNIGCYDKPTHFIKDYPFASLPCGELSEIEHPSVVCPNIEADLFSQIKEYKQIHDIHFLDQGVGFLKDRLESYERGDSLRIPKVIHQIYEDMDGPPSYLLEFAESWRENNPDWVYKFWNKEDIDKFIKQYFPDIKGLYDRFPYSVQRWDVIRYLILYQLGGLYVDMDYECTQSITPLLCGLTCAIGMEPKAHAVRSKIPYIIGNAFMASIPGHPFLKELIDGIFSDDSLSNSCRNKNLEVLETTGPFKLTNCYKRSEYKDQIALIPSEWIAPLSREEVVKLINHEKSRDLVQKVEDSYAIHYFLGSWY